jgi:hypothetical protein
MVPDPTPHWGAGGAGRIRPSRPLFDRFKAGDDAATLATSSRERIRVDLREAVVAIDIAAWLMLAAAR